MHKVLFRVFSIEHRGLVLGSCRCILRTVSKEAYWLKRWRGWQILATYEKWCAWLFRETGCGFQSVRTWENCKLTNQIYSMKTHPTNQTTTPQSNIKPKTNKNTSSSICFVCGVYCTSRMGTYDWWWNNFCRMRIFKNKHALKKTSGADEGIS